MKIILATPIYPPEVGGPATYVRELSERLHNTHEITVVALARHGEAFPGTRLVAINKDQNIFLRLLQFTRVMLREAKHADVIYAQNAMAAGLPAAIVGMIRHKPVIVKFVGDEAWERATQHGKTIKRLEEFLRAPEGGFRTYMFMAIQGFVLRHASLVTTPSAYLRDEIIRAYGLKPENVRLNYNAVDVDTAPPESLKPTHVIASVSRLVKWKNIEGIIQATNILKKKYPDVTLAILGDGPERASLETLVASLKLSDTVTFLGTIHKDEVRKTLKATSVYVLNSTYEGLPHTVLESFRERTPVVATNISGTNEVVLHEQTGLLIPPNDVSALATAIERLFTDRELGTLLAERAHAFLQERFSWERHLTTLQDFFTAVKKS